MSDYTCIVCDEDKFSKELIYNFIEKTEGFSIANSDNLADADIIFIDSEFYETGFTPNKNLSAQIIVVSSNHKYVDSFFKNEITDYLIKSEINYSRFLETIEKIKINRLESLN